MSDIAAIIEENGGQFTASVLGRPNWAVTSATRNGAIAELRTLVANKVASGELTFIPFDTGLASVAGLWRDDPDIKEIVEEIYRERDRDRDRVCAEYDREDAAARANG